MFHVFAALIGLYVIGRFVPSLPVTAGWKWAAAFIILLVSQYHLLNRFLFGGMASPEVPFSILVFGGWLFGAFLLLAGLLLLKDLASLLLLVFRHTGLLSSGFHLGYRTTLGLGVAALLLSAIGVWQAVRIPDVHRIDVTVNRLPAGLDGLPAGSADRPACEPPVPGALDTCRRGQNQCAGSRPDCHYRRSGGRDDRKPRP